VTTNNAAAHRLDAYWHPIGTVEEVTEQPARYTLLGDYLVAYRVDGRAVAFRDLCVHRGAALSLGCVTDGRLRCAYHGWEFDAEGRCVRIPSRPPNAPIPQAARIISVATTEAYGLVWVNGSDPEVPLPPFPENEYGQDGWRGFLSYRSHWLTSAARAVENFMDFSHFPYVHGGLLGSEDRTLVEPYDVIELEEGNLFYTFEQEEPSELYGKGGSQRIRYEYYLYMPFMIHLRKVDTSTGDTTVISMVAAPATAKTTDLYLWIVRNHSFEQPDATFKQFTDTIMEQDRIVVESQRPEELPVELRDELHVRVPDAASIAYRRLLAKYADVSPFGAYGS
jgi:phenylpropionate dioxygenase-like ring-hydroxylating dioxygenase large terminal subunit